MDWEVGRLIREASMEDAISSWGLGAGGPLLADVGKGRVFWVEERKAQKPEIKENIGNLQNCMSLGVMRAQGVGRGIPGRVLPGPNPQGQVHLPSEFVLHPAGSGEILMGCQLGSDMVGLNLGRNILAAAMRMENETGGRRTLGSSRERRCEMAEALFPWAKECKLRCYLELRLVPRVAQLGRKGGGQ